MFPEPSSFKNISLSSPSILKPVDVNIPPAAALCPV